MDLYGAEVKKAAALIQPAPVGQRVKGMIGVGQQAAGNLQPVVAGEETRDRQAASRLTERAKARGSVEG